MTVTPQEAERRQAATDRAPRWSIRSVFQLETLIYLFGSWTIGFWVALVLGRGWSVAVVASVVIFGGLSALVRRTPATPEAHEEPDPEHPGMLVVLAVVLVWPVALELGRGVLAALAVGLLVLRCLVLVAKRRQHGFEVTGLIVAAIAVAAAVAAAISWALFVTWAVVIAALLLLWPSWPDALRARSEPAVADHPSTRRRRRSASTETAVLIAFGVLVGVWHIGTPAFWNPDNAYYLNKAVHYANRAWTFPIEDYMYGVPGIDHLPFGNILSSYEPLAGTLSALSGLSVPVVVFGVLGPGLLALLPFVARYAANGLAVPRPGLVGAVAAASVLMMNQSDTANLFASFGVGKTIGRLIFIPLLLGAIGRLVRQPSRRAAITTGLAAVCAVGMAPSLAVAGLVILLPFTAIGVYQLWQRSDGFHGVRSRARPMVALLIGPLAFLTAYALFAAAYQSQSGQAMIGFRQFASPGAVWEFATSIPLSTGSMLALLFVAGAVATWPIVLGSSALRHGGALMSLLLLGLLFNPLTFDLVIGDVLDLNYFARRILWALPLATLIGVVAANVDRGQRFGLLTIAAVTLGLGLSGPTTSSLLTPPAIDVREAPGRWPWEPGIPPPLLQASDAIVDGTPAGATFLAPSSVEEVTTATQTSRLPTYVRLSYIRTVEAAASTPPSFHSLDRRLLANGINGTSEDVSTERWQTALARAEISTVCLDAAVTPNLRRAVEATFSQRGDTTACILWTRQA